MGLRTRRRPLEGEARLPGDAGFPEDAGHEAVGQALLIAAVSAGALTAVALGLSVVDNLQSFISRLSTYLT
ncbi:hypothetical protein [Kineosporia succinea]|uniref:Uncharacterized protein n=1 Tax=Kineosporia succinea TaxID=84632 RepID=A0ABT9NZG5_9ACTN|nr:hypothetical protein [Kineosporia succinea]MDP9825539.1 hypothetical protein [Kineosporia succinea]